MSRPTRTDKINGGDLVVLYRETDTGYRATTIESIVTVLDSLVHGEGVPLGGTAGQVLAKIDDTNYNTHWVDQTGGGGGGAVDSVNGYTGVVVLAKGDIGLGNVDNTSDANKPISTATQTTLNLKQDSLGFTPVPDTRTVNGHALSSDVTVTKTDVGLGNADNTSDVNKPVSTAQGIAIGLKEDALGNPLVDGYILSSTVAGARSWVAPGGGGGGIPEAPIDGNIYGRKDAGWVLAQGAQMTFDTTIDFGTGEQMATATIADATITNTKIIQAFFTDYLDEIAVLDMRVNERSRSAGVSFDIIGIAPPGAFGTYPVRVITSGI